MRLDARDPSASGRGDASFRAAWVQNDLIVFLECIAGQIDLRCLQDIPKPITFVLDTLRAEIGPLARLSYFLILLFELFVLPRKVGAKCQSQQGIEEHEGSADAHWNTQGQ